MAKSKLYFYITLILVVISFYFNMRNPIFNAQFESIVKKIIISSIVNAIILIIAIIFADKSMKLSKERADWIRPASKFLPYILLITILLHIAASLVSFGLLK
ncbi:hypothetical protein [Staphylococcus debuckii]|uniref:Uncharacterized protein n=1 Tax=Staphylococcus debuckii TaxID=2044912 RepID=A0ABU9EYR9_9STAP|nr:hypothetical protein [Staphylococcus debuckii]AYU55535.1 hypothetical protein CNQ82_08700 [Staphylococcus debuckii]